MKINTSLMLRYVGKSRKQRLLEAFQNQSLVAGSLPLARILAQKATLMELPKQREVMSQGNADDDIYFILNGSMSIRVNNREIAVRSAGEHVGEMALLDTSARRSASAVTCEPSLLAKVTEHDFSRVANRYPDLWRRIAITVAKRLRERNKFQTIPRSEPVIFIGSSSEGLSIARYIYNRLEKRPVVPQLWSEEVFECSKTTIEDLMRTANESDFAVIIFTQDDITKSRGKRKASPRDNVVFELGLFVGALSRERTFIVVPRDTDIKIPTDLLGVTCLPYVNRRNLGVSKKLKPVMKKLYAYIAKYGPK